MRRCSAERVFVHEVESGLSDECRTVFVHILVQACVICVVVCDVCSMVPVFVLAYVSRLMSYSKKYGCTTKFSKMLIYYVYGTCK